MKLNIRTRVKSFVYQNRKVTSFGMKRVQWVEHLGEYGNESAHKRSSDSVIVWCGVRGRKLTTLCFKFYNIRIVFVFSSILSFSHFRVAVEKCLSISLCVSHSFSFIVFHFSAFLAFALQIDGCKCVKEILPLLSNTHTKCCGTDNTELKAKNSLKWLNDAYLHFI